MQSFRIVKFDRIFGRCFCLHHAGKGLVEIKFVLQDAIYPLCKGIFVTMVLFGHADGDLFSFELVGVDIATILYSPVRMVYQVFDGLVMVQGFFERPHTT